MRDKLKPPTTWGPNDDYPLRYYIYDIAESLRLIAAQKESLSSAPEKKEDLDLTPGGLHFHATCVCEACRPTMTFAQHLEQFPGEAAYLKSYGKVVEAEEGLSTGSMSPAEAVKHLGYEDPDELRRLRELEDESLPYDFGSKYFRMPSGSTKGEWYLHEDGRYHWRPDEG